MSTADHREPSPAAVAQVVESLGELLTVSGVPRMPARVWAALLTSEHGAVTASELSQTLQISAAAVSGAVGYLTRVGMIVRRRPLGSRRDVYSLADNSWYETMVNREPLLAAWADLGARSAAALGPDTTAGRRMAESAAFFRFLSVELDGVLKRWAEQRDSPDGPSESA